MQLSVLLPVLISTRQLVKALANHIKRSEEGLAATSKSLMHLLSTTASCQYLYKGTQTGFTWVLQPQHFLEKSLLCWGSRKNGTCYNGHYKTRCPDLPNQMSFSL